LTIAIAALLTAGCATMGPKAPIAPAPTCATEADCAVKWSSARSFVLAHVGYKFQTYSPEFMETFSPVNGTTDLGAQVNREPLPGGGYRIVAKFWCDNLFGCFPNQWETLDGFNRSVAAVGAAQP
jgi:hypothetical protein